MTLDIKPSLIKIKKTLNSSKLFYRKPKHGTDIPSKVMCNNSMIKKKTSHLNICFTPALDDSDFFRFNIS